LLLPEKTDKKSSWIDLGTVRTRRKDEC